MSLWQEPRRFLPSSASQSGKHLGTSMTVTAELEHQQCLGQSLGPCTDPGLPLGPAPHPHRAGDAPSTAPAQLSGVSQDWKVGR